MRHNGLAAIDYYPYGQERGSTPPRQDKFGTYFRDSNGVDYADQRYYIPGAERLMTADPYQVSGGRVGLRLFVSSAMHSAIHAMLNAQVCWTFTIRAS